MITSPGKWRHLNGLVGVIGVRFYPTRRLPRFRNRTVKNHPEERLFASFPSAGPVLVPRLIAAFGTQRDRYGTAADLQSLSGIAPVTERSGRQEWVHFRWACSHFLRQTFHEYAAHSIVTSAWARILRVAD